MALRAAFQIWKSQCGRRCVCFQRREAGQLGGVYGETGVHSFRGRICRGPGQKPPVSAFYRKSQELQESGKQTEMGR